MELRQLRYFVAVAEEGSFTRAAARLHLAQQSLSTAIQRLETQLGAPLLDRTPAGVEPTAAGRALLDRAPAVFAAMQAALGAVHDASGAVGGELGLRYGRDSDAVVEPLLAAFQHEHPAIAVQAWPGMDADNVGALRAGEVDAVFAWAAVPGDLTGVAVAEEEALLALPDRHRLAGLDVVPVDEVAREPLVLFQRDAAPAVWDHLVAGLRGATVDPSAVVQTPVTSQSAMAEAVLRGEGVCPVSASLAPALQRPGLVLRPLDPALRTPLLLAWRGQPSPCLRALSAFVAAQRV